MVVRTSDLAAPGGEEVGFEIPHKALFSENCNCHYLTCLIPSWKFHLLDLSLFDLTQSLLTVNTQFPGPFKQNNGARKSWRQGKLYLKLGAQGGLHL